MGTRNYKEDQANEVEALESIYYGDMEILSSEPYKVRISIKSENFTSEEEGVDDIDSISCFLVISMGSKYPDEAPIIEIEDPVNFVDGFEKELLDYIGQIVEENMGMEMGFTLVSSCTEWLNLKWDKLKADLQEEKEHALRIQEEAERKKFEGTRVSVETFMAWKKEFDLDMGITEKREKALIDSKKLTGKELFLRDTTLNESDLKFLLEAGDSIESVKIDESLFADIGELDIDDSDDEDYIPGQEV